MDLDFSDLTNDQLVALARACCLEAVRRSPAVHQAMQDMMLSEAEKVRIAKHASEAEAAAARARERERIAMEARARVRAEEDRKAAQDIARMANEAAQRAATTVELARYRDMTLLRQAAALVGRAPADISLLHVRTQRGQCFYINPGMYRYTREHLVTCRLNDMSISTTAALVERKPELVTFCASAAVHLPNDSFIVGSAYRWPEE